jgi:hypothetical protein
MTTFWQRQFARTAHARLDGPPARSLLHHRRQGDLIKLDDGDDLRREPFETRKATLDAQGDARFAVEARCAGPASQRAHLVRLH